MNYVLKNIGIENNEHNKKISYFILRNLEKRFFNNYFKKYDSLMRLKQSYDFFKEKEKNWLSLNYELLIDMNEIMKKPGNKIRGKWLIVHNQYAKLLMPPFFCLSRPKNFSTNTPYPPCYNITVCI